MFVCLVFLYANNIKASKFILAKLSVKCCFDYNLRILISYFAVSNCSEHFLFCIQLIGRIHKDNIKMHFFCIQCMYSICTILTNNYCPVCQMRLFQILTNTRKCFFAVIYKNSLCSTAA